MDTKQQKGKLIAGIVLTGGGSQLKHLRQLVEYITGMDARIGFPNEHLAGDSDEAYYRVHLMLLLSVC